MSENEGIPFPPVLRSARTLASVGFLPLFILSFLNRPFSPGPVFFSSLSALWHTAQLSSKAVLPLPTSPFFACPSRFDIGMAAASNAAQPDVISIFLMVVICNSLQFRAWVSLVEFAQKAANRKPPPARLLPIQTSRPPAERSKSASG